MEEGERQARLGKTSYPPAKPSTLPHVDVEEPQHCREAEPCFLLQKTKEGTERLFCFPTLPDIPEI